VRNDDPTAGIEGVRANVIASFKPGVGMTVVSAPAAPAGKVKICQVTDVGGIDDKSFNATAWKGVQDAIDQLGVEGQFLESQEQADYAKNIQEFLDSNCDLIITVGFLLGDATKEAANANPDQKFAIVDFAYAPEDIPANNVLGLTFNTSEAGFLAGYLAAGMTKTGTVGTFGGINIPPVTVFMDGYAWGVRYYNKVHGTDVQVLGWDPETKDGLFTGNFESLDDGRTFAESLFDEGADIVLPVAGPVGLGSAAAAQERGMMLIGVDTDWYVSAPEYRNVELTSIMKNMDVAVFNASKAVQDGTFEGGVYVGTLANGGVGIAPFHEFDSKVPDSLKAEIEKAKDAIIDGKLKVGPELGPADLVSGGAPSVALPPAPPAEEAAALFTKGGCGGCHVIPGIDGAVGVVGPSMCGLAEEMRDGEDTPDDVFEAIVDPNAEIVEGYAANIMPQNFGDLFTKDEINTMVAFIANLKCE
jgi:basic membrane protein A